jgi:EAL domain-containing protein (putative c-di-GMP-specific phosphodiesterase class I)
MDDVISKMRTLKKMGIRVSLDDFGIGHSSLVYLKKLPVT